MGLLAGLLMLGGALMGLSLLVVGATSLERWLSRAPVEPDPVPSRAPSDPVPPAE